MNEPWAAAALLPPGSAFSRLLPGEVYPGHPHLVGLAPVDHPGRAAELLMNGNGRATSYFLVDAGEIGETWRDRLGVIKASIAIGAVVFLCQNRRDRSEARRRLAAVAPVGHTIRG